MAAWDPAKYELFKSFRDRPALDLMVQIPQDLEPRQIWDLGCGTGEHAVLLALRHPEACVSGLDSSAEMLSVAKGRSGSVEWIKAGIEDFAPSIPPDLIFTNAALQWVPDHESIFPRLVSRLARGGVFACQIPVTFDQSWHIQLRQTATEGPWASKMIDVRDVKPVASAAAYFDWLSPLAEVDIWTTTYLHALAGPEPVIEWMKGTGLRPYLQALADEEERSAFLEHYRKKVDRAFPARPDGTTLFPFPRLFILARAR